MDLLLVPIRNPHLLRLHDPILHVHRQCRRLVWVDNAHPTLSIGVLRAHDAVQVTSSPDRPRPVRQVHVRLVLATAVPLMCVHGVFAAPPAAAQDF